MSQIYSRRLLTSHSGGAASYTTPDGKTTVIRCITAFNPNAVLPETAAVVLTETAVTIWQVGNLGGASLDVGNSVAVELRVVLDEGESIHLVSGGDVDMTVCGYELTNP
jgi:hypothetical protein